MKPTNLIADSTVSRARFRLPTILPLSAACFFSGMAAILGVGSMQARPVPANLGNGLDKLVESNLAISNAKDTGVQLDSLVTLNGKTYTDAATAAVAKSALSDDQGRVLVRVTLNGQSSLKETRRAMKAAVTSLTVTAQDPTYRGVGVMNAYVDVSEVPTLAKVPGVSAVILEWKPRHTRAEATVNPVMADPDATVGQVLNKLGTAFDQGVIQHRVDTINRGYNPSAPVDYEGQGMKIGCISNSFASNTTNSVTIDVNNGDLPGPGNPYNTTPVYVLQDDVGDGTSDDEGRAMCQIVYKMAPKASLAFATADTGEVGFANNIRLLGGLTVNGMTGTFGADVVCDDVGYFDEPFFQDGIIGGGVDDVAAAGVSYFSSAANDIGTNGYDSDLRWVPNGTGLTAAAGNAALAGTNINLAGVPTNLYAGGFHNFNPNGKDVAQTVNDPSTGSTPTILQWNEPYDQTSQPNDLTTIWTQSGNYTNSTAGTAGDLTYTITPALTQGVLYQLVEAANGSTFDGIITIKDPNGNVVVGPQDTGTDETARFYAPVSGAGYTVTVGHYSTTTGAFNLTLQSSSGFTGNIVQTQVYLLVFDTAGNYIPASSLTTNALTTNQPLQLGYTLPNSGSQVQYVIARGNAPTGPNVATHVRYQIPGNGLGGLGPAEYFTYNTVTTGGHAMARGCNGTAAYNAFRPSLPATFTSPGPVTIYFDKLNNRLSTPEVRLQPRIAANNASNISTNMSYFTNDSGSDPDTNPNFSGTSAAAPHAAAIAGLVLQSHGGRRSLTSAQMTDVLQRSTFPHDLDPNFSSGSARVTGDSTGTGKITINISSDASTASAAGTTATGGNDTNGFTVSYVGGSSITSLVFNPGGTSATAGNPTGGNNGVTYSATGIVNGGTATYFENSLPGVCFLPSTKAFTLNPASVAATAAFTNLSSGTNQYYTMTITPGAGALTGGKQLRFTVGRGLARSASTGNVATTVISSTTGAASYTADIFGGGVALPSGQVLNTGMTFSGTTADGGTFTGTINNRIGSGWATQDGYGLINAQTAVSQTVQ